MSKIMCFEYIESITVFIYTYIMVTGTFISWQRVIL